MSAFLGEAAANVATKELIDLLRDKEI